MFNKIMKTKKGISGKIRNQEEHTSLIQTTLKRI